MKPHQERVISEKGALDDKRQKLSDFMISELFQTLPAIEQSRLHFQLDAMDRYSKILGERITAFE